MKVNNFAIVRDRKACDVKNFHFFSRKMYKTWISLKLNILCSLHKYPMNSKFPEFDKTSKFYPIFHSNKR